MEWLAAAGISDWLNSLDRLDMVILIVVLFTTVMGLWSGLIWQVYRIVSLVVGFTLSSRFAQPMSDALGERIISNEKVRLLVCYIIVFAAVIIVSYAVGRLIKGLVKKVKLGSVDILLGGLLGFLKGALICGAVLIGIVRYLPAESSPVQAVQRSKVGPVMVKVTQRMWLILPAEFRQELGEKMQQKEDETQQQIQEKARETLWDRVEKALPGSKPKAAPADEGPGASHEKGVE